MIEWISNWAETIIVAVIIATIIEMILPEGNSKKYIKVVIGVYVLFTIITPVINKFSGKSIQVSDVIDLEKYIEETEHNIKMQNTIRDNNQSNIIGIYKNGLKKDIKVKIEEKGFIVNNISIDIADDENYTIQMITMELEARKSNDTDGSAQKGDNKTNNKNNMENSYTDKNNEYIEDIKMVNIVEIKMENDSNETTEKNKIIGTLTSNQINEIKEYISEIYNVNKEKIKIN